jgi:hypothetical protein
MKHLRGRLTYANVIATLALFIALGGASYAAVKLPKNSVGSRQIKNGAVTRAKIGKNAVTAASIAPGAITQTAINPSTLGTVPSATNAIHANSADTAASAANANTLGGLPPEAFAQASHLVSGAVKVSASAATIATVPGLFTLSTRPGHASSVEIVFSGTDSWTVEEGSSGFDFSAPNAVNLNTVDPIFIADLTTTRFWVAQCHQTESSHFFGCVVTGG